MGGCFTCPICKWLAHGMATENKRGMRVGLWHCSILVTDGCQLSQNDLEGGEVFTQANSTNWKIFNYIKNIKTFHSLTKNPISIYTVFNGAIRELLVKIFCDSVAGY